jgi:hypothetical protein
MYLFPVEVAFFIERYDFVYVFFDAVNDDGVLQTNDENAAFGREKTIVELYCAFWKDTPQLNSQLKLPPLDNETTDSRLFTSVSAHSNQSEGFA